MTPTGMLVDPRQLGLPPGAKTREQIGVLDYDTIGYAPSTLLTEQLMFDTSAKRREYRSQSFPSTTGRRYYWRYLRVVHNFQFTLTDASLALAEQQRFEEASYLSIKIEDKDQYRFSLSMLTPYDIVANGSTLTLKDKLVSWFKLPEPLELPENGAIEVKFTPAVALTTAASGVSTPPLPYLLTGAASDVGFAAYFQFWGVVDRPVK